MKTKITLFLVIALLFTGCDWFKDLDDVTIDTDLTLDIPVVVAGVKSASVITDESGVNFSASQDLNLEDNQDIEPYLQKIKKIDLKSLVVTVRGLQAGQTINTISLAVTGVGTICTHTNITSTTNEFTPMIVENMLDQAAAKLKSDKKITVTVSGNASEPMTFTVGLNFAASITANALD